MQETGQPFLINLHQATMDNKIKCFSSVHHCGSYSTPLEMFCQVFKKFVFSLGILLHRVLYPVSTILLLLVIVFRLCIDLIRLHT